MLNLWEKRLFSKSVNGNSEEGEIGITAGDWCLEWAAGNGAIYMYFRITNKSPKVSEAVQFRCLKRSPILAVPRPSDRVR